MTAHVFKILVTGPYAAGKTSLIQSVSQTDVVSTDVVTSGEEAEVKEHTTVAMDFGTYTVSEDDTDDIRLLLFGTPGQPRFRFMTDILKGDVDIVAFVVDATAKGTHPSAGVELRSLLADLRVPAVIAVNRCDDDAVARRIARSLGATGAEAIVPCQLVDPESGRDVVVEILLTLLDTLEDEDAEADLADDSDSDDTTDDGGHGDAADPDDVAHPEHGGRDRSSTDDARERETAGATR